MNSGSRPLKRSVEFKVAWAVGEYVMVYRIEAEEILILQGSASHGRAAVRVVDARPAGKISPRDLELRATPAGKLPLWSTWLVWR